MFKTTNKAEEILKEFIEDVEAVTGGTGEGWKDTLNWPDLAITYEKAVDYLKERGN